jgi:hypothetical protein
MGAKYINLDSNESVFFDRELEHIKAQTYDVKTPLLKAVENIPVSTEAGPAAETTTYYQYDEVGMAKLISNYADDLPRVDIKAKEFTSKIKSVGDAYGYNIQEIRASASANKNLPTRKATAARKAVDQKINKIAWKARADDGINGGLVGLLYNANITKGTVTIGATTGVYPFSGKNATEILYDLNKLVDDVITLTHGVEVPDTVLLPIAQHSLISTTYRSTTSDLTILEAFLKNRPYITKVDWIAEFKDVNPIPSTGVASDTDIMVAFRRDPDALTLEIPQPFEQFEVERRGLEYVVPCHARCGGVIVYYPLSVNIVEGI